MFQTIGDLLVREFRGKRLKLRLLRPLCERLHPFDKIEIVTSLAPGIGISGLISIGQYGAVQGSSADAVVFGAYARNGVWGKRTVDVLKDFFTRAGDGVYIDIGANIGLTTIPLAQLAGVHCIAIEPEPSNYGYLLKNVKENCIYDNVETHQLAIFEEERTIDFDLSASNLGDHRVRLSGVSHSDAGQSKTISVRAVRLDDLVGKIDGPLAVKVDTQGAEPFVISGGTKVLGQAGLVILEFWPYGMRRIGTTPEIVFDFLTGFRTIQLAYYEDEPLGPPLTPTEACTELRAMFKSEEQAQGEAYLDIVAYRE